MVNFSGAFREALSDADVPRLLSLWAAAKPGMPQPKNLAEGEVVLHQARTEAKSITLAKRLYSHAWLEERAMKSSLPDELRPPAQQVRPRIVSAVGVSVNMRGRHQQGLARAVEAAMSQVAGEMIDAGILDSALISARMWEAHDRVLSLA